MNKYHPTALVETKDIGKNTNIWAFTHILKGSKIGDNCNICDYVYIEYGVTIGNNVTIKNYAFLPEGVVIEDDVFIGPHVVFTNDLYPISKNKSFQPMKTIIKQGASIGANSTILPGITIGAGSMIGAGSIVTKDVSPGDLVYGNPANSVLHAKAYARGN